MLLTCCSAASSAFRWYEHPRSQLLQQLRFYDLDAPGKCQDCFWMCICNAQNDVTLGDRVTSRKTRKLCFRAVMGSQGLGFRDHTLEPSRSEVNGRLIMYLGPNYSRASVLLG